MNKLATLFDADGVFLRTEHPGSYLEYRYGLSRAQTAPFQEVLNACLVGKADLKQELPRFLKEWGIKKSAEDFLQAAFTSGSGIDSSVADVVKGLRARGIACGLATSQDRHRMAFLDRRLHIRAYFDSVFVSCEIGAKKPDHDFYDAVGKQWPGYKLAFWDDRPENVSAAHESGWTAFVFKDVATLQNDIAAILS